jgi:integrase
MPSGGRSSSAEASSVRSRQAVRLSSGSTSVSQAVSPTRHMPADATSRTGMLLPVISRNRCKDGLFPSEGREFEPRPPLWKASLDTTSSRPRRSWGSSARPPRSRDAAIFLTAAFTGLRREEPVALRWRDVDFAGFLIRVRAIHTHEALTTPKSGRVRPVPTALGVAARLVRLRQRGVRSATRTRPCRGRAAATLDGSALRRRYARAGLRRLPRPAPHVGHQLPVFIGRRPSGSGPRSAARTGS